MTIELSAAGAGLTGLVARNALVDLDDWGTHWTLTVQTAEARLQIRIDDVCARLLWSSGTVVMKEQRAT
jgi:hypothetical protein